MSFDSFGTEDSFDFNDLASTRNPKITRDFFYGGNNLSQYNNIFDINPATAIQAIRDWNTTPGNSAEAARTYPVSNGDVEDAISSVNTQVPQGNSSFTISTPRELTAGEINNIPIEEGVEDTALAAEEVGGEAIPGVGEAMAMGALAGQGLKSVYTQDEQQAEAASQSQFRYGLGSQMNQSNYIAQLQSNLANEKSTIDLGTLFGPAGVALGGILNAIFPQQQADLNTTFSTGGQMVNGTSAQVADTMQAD